MTSKLALGAALAGAALLGALAVGYGSAQPDADPAPTRNASSGDVFTASEEEEIRALVHDYLLDNPEVIIDALNEFQARQRVAEEQKLKSGAKSNLSALLKGDGGYTAGADADDAKVAVVEFFDYHCGFCKRANGLVRELTKNDPAVKVVFRELPILRDESDTAAEYALAAREQGKYVDLHFALMEASGVLTEDRIKDIAKKAGVDVKALTAARKDRAIKSSLEETVRIAREMGVDGTPAFIIASTDGAFVEVLPGYRPEEILAAVEAAKKAAS
ncbi:MAG: DsbA family protein [Pseudomonadota bacterium]